MNTQTLTFETQTCLCPTTEIIKQGFTGWDVMFLLIAAVAISLALGHWIGWYRGNKFSEMDAIKNKLGEYAIDIDTGKIKFWWTGKPGRK